MGGRLDIIRLLIIEDDQETGTKLAAALRKIDASYDIVWVNCVEAAIVQLEQSGKFDIALVDLGLPDAHDLQAPTRLCKRFPDLAVVALTGDFRPGLATELIRIGAQDYLRKGSQGPQAVHRALLCALERQSRELALKADANVDELTGLLNRRGCRQALVNALTDNRGGRQACTVFAVDLDGFKPVNDNFGHGVGDAVLVQCALRMASCVRHMDKVARVGGDEFVVICPGLLDADTTASLAANLVETIGEPYSVEQQLISVTASIGVAHAPKDSKTAKGLLRCSDVALYAAKERGKNGWAEYSDINNNEKACTGKAEKKVADEGLEEAEKNYSTSDVHPISAAAYYVPAKKQPVDISANFTHELNNQLNCILLEIEVAQLVSSLQTPIGVGDALMRIKQNVEAISKLNADLQKQMSKTQPTQELDTVIVKGTRFS